MSRINWEVLKVEFFESTISLSEFLRQKELKPSGNTNKMTGTWVQDRRTVGADFNNKVVQHVEAKMSYQATQDGEEISWVFQTQKRVSDLLMLRSEEMLIKNKEIYVDKDGDEHEIPLTPRGLQQLSATVKNAGELQRISRGITSAPNGDDEEKFTAIGGRVLAAIRRAAEKHRETGAVKISVSQ